jgi:hypothetical protein
VKILLSVLGGYLMTSFSVMVVGPFLPKGRLREWANENVGLALLLFSLPAMLAIYAVLRSEKPR